MRIKFDGRQPFQLQAIDAVCDLFHGQPLASIVSPLTVSTASGDLFDELGVANHLLISEAQILENLRAIQRRNAINEATALEGMNFTVEMETGTGKTYAYLRTAYELNAKFGFKKFVVVVPTVAIREGVRKSIEMTRDH